MQSNELEKINIIRKDVCENAPSISIIIPVYNCEKFIRECYYSIAEQKLKNIQIIYIDDGSTDQSINILKNLADGDNRIMIICQNHRGAGYARNLGIKYSRGEFIAFMDADDMYPSGEVLYKLYTEAIYHNVNICGGSLWQLRNGELCKDASLFEKGYTFNHDGLIDYIDYQYDFGYWRFIYKKEFIIKNNIQFPSYLRGQDPPFFVKCMLLARKFYAIKDPTYIYRVSSNHVVWTPQKICDVYNSYKDLLIISKQNSLINLHNLIVSRIANRSLIEYIDVYNEDIRKTILSTISEVNYDYLDQYNNINLSMVFSYIHKTNPTFLISVIVSVYNQEKYIKDCLNSIINQTCKNLEIICINDGSTDNSLNILREFKKNYKNFVLINQRNKGLSRSRNEAISISRGKYILFVDSDDLLRNDALEKLFLKMERRNLDMLSFSGMNFIGDIANKIENKYWTFSYLPKNFNKDVFNWRDCKSFLHRMAVSSCLTMYKASFIKNNKIFFPDRLCFEDNLFFIKSITKANRCGILNEKFYYRRVHSASITQNWDKHFLDYIKVSMLVLNYLLSIRIEKSVYENYRQFFISGIKRRFNTFSISLQSKYKVMYTDFLYMFGDGGGEPSKILRLCGVPIYLHKRTCQKDKVSLLKIEIFKKIFTKNKRKTYIFGIPYYSIEIKGAKITKQIFFIRYSYVDKFRMLSLQIQDIEYKLHNNKKLLVQLTSYLNECKTPKPL